MKKQLLLLGFFLVAFFAHILTQYYLFSLFQAAISIPLFIMLMHPRSVTLALTTWGMFELFSSLPQGSMLLMFLIPYAFLLLWRKFKVDLSWKSFLGILALATLQILALIGIRIFTGHYGFFTIPWTIYCIQILCTAIGTFILTFIYHEYAERL